MFAVFVSRVSTHGDLASGKVFYTLRFRPQRRMKKSSLCSRAIEEGEKEEEQDEEEET